MWKEREEGTVQYRRRGAKELERGEKGEVGKAEGTKLRIWHRWVREKKGELKV